MQREKKIPVAVLGATGAVGQTFIRLLHNHPWFEVREVAASERSAGKSYVEATHWLEGRMPESVARLKVAPCDPASVSASIVFSALDASVAGDIEQAFARDGRYVFSNAKNYRLDPDVPLMIPEINADQLELLRIQQKNRGWKGAILTNANCAATVAALALAPLHQKYRVKTLFMSTMQAVSGAGYPGVASLDILGNVIPFIKDEEPKLEREMLKLLGRYDNGKVVEPQIQISSHTNRVPVEHGHTVCMSVKFETRPTPADAIAALRSWTGAKSASDLPSSPERAIHVFDEDNRPQPRRDVNIGNGMTVSVGRVRVDPILDIRMVALGHNTIRGAAGGSVMNAELLVASGIMDIA